MSAQAPELRPLRRLAIVNRGEAAMRCIRAVKALRTEEGSPLEVVALYTESDRDAPFVRHADAAWPLPAPRGEVAAYLDHDALLEVLREAEVDAVWPGWGFVAEDPRFVERLAAAGIRFLGPPASAMRGLGDKIDAKRLAERAGVPVTPWSGGEVADPSEASRHAARIGWPVVLKASAGGGGRGIRIVSGPDTMEAAFRSAASEARAAFGDDRLFVEDKVEGGRHVEVQIAADAHGHVLALGCRDCSVQRRHQKVIEEAPPPRLAPGVDEALRRAAIAVAADVGYQGVGTVEFLVTGERFHFLEMNPRLQVEHGITEAITGLDLVQLQIRIARGESIAGFERTERGHAIEARVCAEDPDAGFLPSPGRIARFDPALGPRVRIDTGVAAGSSVPAAFDSLVAKVIATGATREEARARLAAALDDFDLVIEGGASNKGWLAEILRDPDFRAGGVDTTWLDRRAAAERGPRPFAAPALVAAAIVSYQRARAAARLNFFADTSNLGPTRVPPSQGQEIDLTRGGETYRLRVYAMGGWRYRVHADGRVVAATLREEGAHTARLLIGQRSYRVLHDVTETGIRLEVEGAVHRFGSSSAGQVRAAAPAMVVSIDVGEGDAVRAGQPLGVLEAMKMEVGIEAPLTGMVTEVRVRKGEQVAAGDVLLVIDPVVSEEGADLPADRIALEEEPDPLALLFRGGEAPAAGEPDLRGAAHAAAPRRRAAIQAVGEEVRRVLLGYDANPERADRLAAFLEAPLPEGLDAAFLAELASVRRELVRFADVARLFIRAPQASVSGGHGPSNQARLRMYVRRMRAAGAGIAEEFLELVRRALSHYGIASLEPSDALERAVLRMLASQLQPELRDRLVLGLLTRTTALARHGVHLGADRELAAALEDIAGMRGLVSHAVADAAIETRYVIFERPEIEAQAERTSKEMQVWLDAAEAEPTAPPEAVSRHLADAPPSVFERVGRWLDDDDVRRRAIALAAHLRRLYSPLEPEGQATLRDERGRWIERLDLPGGGLVLGGAASPAEAAVAARVLVHAAESSRESHEWPAAHALELLVPVADAREAG
ncbi:MAG: biotin carboxylase N-terminal domain-containing protein, partial [Myxococcota bacterium]|nr:biotin carboxylase N-terminal domain-containing protein [Myxococcota bacterium]